MRFILAFVLLWVFSPVNGVKVSDDGGELPFFLHVRWVVVDHNETPLCPRLEGEHTEPVKRYLPPHLRNPMHQDDTHSVERRGGDSVQQLYVSPSGNPSDFSASHRRPVPMNKTYPKIACALVAIPCVVVVKGVEHFPDSYSLQIVGKNCTWTPHARGMWGTLSFDQSAMSRCNPQELLIKLLYREIPCGAVYCLSLPHLSPLGNPLYILHMQVHTNPITGYDISACHIRGTL